MRQSMKIGYARVSTQDQRLELQTDALAQCGCGQIYKERKSGKNKERPELEKMISQLRSGDTVVVWKLDRLGRSLRDLIELVAEFKERGVEFVSLQDGINTATPTGRFTFNIFASLAEFERELIRERTNAGLDQFSTFRKMIVYEKPGDRFMVLLSSGNLSISQSVREILQICAERGITILEASKGELDRLTSDAVHQGVALQVPAYEYAHPDDLLSVELPGTPLIVALDGITDPRNLGAIVRSAAGFGAHGVVIPERRAASMTASAWKTSAGAAARCPVAQTVNLTRQIKAYQDAGCFVVGLAADGDLTLPEMLADTDLTGGPLVLVIGSEGDGLSRLVAETCDRLMSIPMAGVLESLNAGVAASVTLYAVAEARSRG